MRRASILLVILCSSPAYATSFSFDLSPHDISSPNGAFILTVRPKTGIHTVYSSTDKSTPLWSIIHAAFLESFYVANDGSSVAIVAFDRVSEKDFPTASGIEFWSNGGMSRSYRVQELCPDPDTPEKTGWHPVGWMEQFPMTWRRQVKQDGDNLLLTTPDGNEYKFRLEDGEIISKRNLQSLWVLDRRHAVLLLSAGLVVMLGLTYWLKRPRGVKLAPTQ